jgi:hypothetical protein
VAAPPRAAPADPPAPLPSPLTALIGREDELAGLTALLPSARLVTLTGPGGVGKTRLALEAARVAAAGFPDRVTFVPLSGLRDPALIGRAIADALGLREVGGRPVRDVLRERLTGAPRLLLLDNFEHLLEAGPDVADLLAACPDLHVLVTSRAPLGVRGEQRFPIAPLPEAPAIELFVERARAAQPALDLSPASRDVFARICQRLDRLPLALELAAARVAILEPVELLARLDPVLPMLAGGLRDLPERQQTMELRAPQPRGAPRLPPPGGVRGRLDARRCRGRLRAGPGRARADAALPRPPVVAAGHEPRRPRSVPGRPRRPPVRHAGDHPGLRPGAARREW